MRYLGMRGGRKWIRKAWIWLAFVALFVLAALWIKIRLGITSLNPFAAEVDTLEKETKSPDGRYTAKLYYRENLAMTYGFFHIGIQSNTSDESDPDVIEVADEGLSNLRWSDSRTLVVAFDATKNKHHLDDTMFVKKPNVWRSIRIVYVPKLSK